MQQRKSSGGGRKAPEGKGQVGFFFRGKAGFLGEHVLVEVIPLKKLLVF